MEVKPLYKNKYYVYILTDPQGIPFYVGKGKGDRINNHFKSNNLRKNSYKNSIIKKYGDKVKRCIVSYHDKEEDAYSQEEFLISYYGKLKNGGVLTNILECREDFYKFNKGQCKQDNDTSLKYKKDIVYKIYQLYYLENKSLRHIKDKFNIGDKYLKAILKGEKREKLFENFQNIHNVCFYVDHLRTPYSKYEEDTIIRAYTLYYKDGLDLVDISEETGINSTYLYYLITGKKRPKLLESFLNKEHITQQEYVRSKGVNYFKNISDVGKVYYLRYILGLNPINISKYVNFSPNYIQNLICGAKRQKDLERFKDGTTIVFHNSTKLPLQKLSKVVLVGYLIENYKLEGLYKTYNVSKTTVHRIKSTEGVFDSFLNKDFLSKAVNITNRGKNFEITFKNSSSKVVNPFELVDLLIKDLPEWTGEE